MTYIERKRDILHILESHHGACKTNTLCESLFASRSTIRRDLITLEKLGLITRYHGSVVLNKTSASEASASMRKMENPSKKHHIAHLAKSFLENNKVIFLDSSTTVSYLIPHIETFDHITVITNGINIASELSNSNNINCYVCPGLLKNQSASIIGEYSLNFLDNFSAQIAFLSCKSINTLGVFEGSDQQAFIKRKMLANAHTKILLCDNSKEFTQGYFKLSNFDDFDIIISNDKFSENLMSVITKTNCQFIYQ